MINNIDFDTSPIVAGESRPLRAISNSPPLTVTVLCYLTTPPPPGYRPCSGGGAAYVKSGEVVTIEADRNVFQYAGNYLDIKVKDLSGDVKTFRLGVIVDSSGSSTQTMMAGG
jgi:hypothetical protein